MHCLGRFNKRYRSYSSSIYLNFLTILSRYLIPALILCDGLRRFSIPISSKAAIASFEPVFGTSAIASAPAAFPLTARITTVFPWFSKSETIMMLLLWQLDC